MSPDAQLAIDDAAITRELRAAEGKEKFRSKQNNLHVDACG